jgi:hypothetical protein
VTLTDDEAIEQLDVEELVSEDQFDVQGFFGGVAMGSSEE